MPLRMLMQWESSDAAADGSAMGRKQKLWERLGYADPIAASCLLASRATSGMART